MVGFPVTMVVGILLERVSVHSMIAMTFIVQSIAIVMMIYMDGMGGAIIFAATWGVAAGFEQISLQVT